MNSLKTILIILVTVGAVVAIGAYILFGNQPAPTSSAIDLSVASKDTTPAGTAERQFLSLLASLQPTTLNTTLLSDPRFTALTDFRVAIIPEASGRVNPFLPLQ